MIEELTEALERERRRTRQLEIAQEALLERAARRHELSPGSATSSAPRSP